MQYIPQYKKDIKLLASVQRMAANIIKGLEVKTYEEWLRLLGLFNLEETDGRPHGSLQLLQGVEGQHLSLSSGDRQRT